MTGGGRAKRREEEKELETSGRTQERRGDSKGFRDR